MLQPVDLLVALKLSARPAEGAHASGALALALGASPRQVDVALMRLAESRLIDPRSRTPRARNLFEFVTSGVPYWLPAEPGVLARGMPTATSGPTPLGLAPAADGEAGQWVWSTSLTVVTPRVGRAIEPIHPLVPVAASADQRLYEVLSLVEILRIGSVRERDAARVALKAAFEVE